jgi:hypothetical protein
MCRLIVSVCGFVLGELWHAFFWRLKELVTDALAFATLSLLVAALLGAVHVLAALPPVVALIILCILLP